jgi:hypothetical protein
MHSTPLAGRSLQNQRVQSSGGDVGKRLGSSHAAPGIMAFGKPQSAPSISSAAMPLGAAATFW